jgi:hypothetical protein
LPCRFVIPTFVTSCESVCFWAWWVSSGNVTKFRHRFFSILRCRFPASSGNMFRIMCFNFDVLSSLFSLWIYSVLHRTTSASAPLSCRAHSSRSHYIVVAPTLHGVIIAE